MQVEGPHQNAGCLHVTHPSQIRFPQRPIDLREPSAFGYLRRVPICSALNPFS